MAAVADEIGRRADALQARINASYAQSSQAGIDAIHTLFQATEDDAANALITLDSLKGQITELVAQGRNPVDGGFLTYLDNIIKAGGAAADAAKKVKDNLTNLVLAAQLAAQTPDALGGPVDARRTSPTAPAVVDSPALPAGISASGKAFKERIAEAGRVEVYRQSLLKLTDAELNEAEASALASGSEARYNVVLGVVTARTQAHGQALDDAASHSQALNDATAQLVAAQESLGNTMLGTVNGPYHDQIESLAQLRRDFPELADQIGPVITQFEKLDEAAQRQHGVQTAINTYGQYAQQAIPGVVAAMQVLGGASDEVAGQWGQDLGSMVSDVASFSQTIVSGNYVQAAITALTSIFTYFARQAQAGARGTQENRRLQRPVQIHRQRLRHPHQQQLHHGLPVLEHHPLHRADRHHEARSGAGR